MVRIGFPNIAGSEAGRVKNAQKSLKTVQQELAEVTKQGWLSGSRERLLRAAIFQAQALDGLLEQLYEEFTPEDDPPPIED